MPRRVPPLPTPVQRALRQLGADLRAARIRRHLPMAVVAERAMTTRPTLTKIERGDPGVSIGTWITVLYTLGFLDRLTAVTDPATDTVGFALDEAHRPRRVRRLSAGSR